MYKTISYGNKKLEEIVKSKHVIPYSLGKRDKYEKGNYYFSGFYGKVFRVLFVKYYNTGELEGAEIKHSDGLHAYMCTDIDPDYDYRMIKDDNNLSDKSSIINDGKIYTGAEIKYWFFMNNIDCFNRKFKGFWKYLDTYSDKVIDDNARYMMTADTNHLGNYINCKLIRFMN
jgi:hypothetical protein